MHRSLLNTGVLLIGGVLLGLALAGMITQYSSIDLYDLMYFTLSGGLILTFVSIAIDQSKKVK